MYKIENKTSDDISSITVLMKSFMPFAQKRMGWNRPPTIKFQSDPENAQNPLGKTGHYDPSSLTVAVYIDKRHPKDILRSLSHELVHHTQNCRGEFEGATGAGEQGYAQNDPHLRGMESEAYELGNMCFRDWEDGYKQSNYSVDIDISVSLQEWRNDELNSLLMEKFIKGVKK
jgi:hypothetical protein|tara:strand:+ start:1239 stop:1757 length:519 start_codon:yes stop_codon:yes gene_type:complete